MALSRIEAAPGAGHRPSFYKLLCYRDILLYKREYHSKRGFYHACAA